MGRESFSSNRNLNDQSLSMSRGAGSGLLRHRLLFGIASLLLACFASALFADSDAPAESTRGRYLLIIAGSDTAARDLQPLLALRRGQGWGVTIRTLEQATPETIIDLVSSERERLPSLSHVLLVGPHSQLPMAPRPNYLIQRLEPDVPILTDDAYGIPDQDGVPQLAVGRLCAEAGPQLRQLAAKIVQYEKSLEKISPHVFVVAGRQPVGGGSHPGAAAAQAAVDQMTMGFLQEGRAALVNLQLRARTAFPSDQYFQFEEGPSVLQSGLAERPLMAAYAGHGTREGFATFHDTENVTSIDREDIGKFQIADPCGPFTSTGCSTLDPEGDRPSIGEEILILKGGPVAVLGFTRINDDFYAAQLLETIVNELNKARTVTLGELVVTIKRRLVNEPQSTRSKMMQDMMTLAGQMRPEVMQIDYQKAVRKNNAMLTLLGDPTTTLVIP